jgi:hypothetical protein
MATFNRKVGIAFGPQTTEGTADTTIVALSGALDLDDGIVLGDVGSGLVESGITHSFTRRLREKGTVAGSFTRLASDFLEEEVSLSFAFPMAGNRKTTTTPDSLEFEAQKGIKALLGACGLDGITSPSNPTVGWKYTPEDCAIATARIFDSGVAWVIRDIRGDWSLAQAPGEIGIMTCTLNGIVDSFNAAVTFPTFDFEEQATINAPSVQNVNPVWGAIGRGWTDLTLSCANNIESIPDSASDVGKSFEQTGREITLSMNIRASNSDLDYARSQLILDSNPSGNLDYTVGVAASASDPAVAYQVKCSNLEVTDYTPDVAGMKASSNVTAVCTGTTDASEFFLAFL